MTETPNYAAVFREAEKLRAIERKAIESVAASLLERTEPHNGVKKLGSGALTVPFSSLSNGWILSPRYYDTKQQAADIGDILRQKRSLSDARDAIKCLLDEKKYGPQNNKEPINPNVLKVLEGIKKELSYGDIGEEK